jgi:hypothetical protein
MEQYSINNTTDAIKTERKEDTQTAWKDAISA